MADFCKQCSIEMFGKDFRELAGLTTVEDTAKGLYATGVICEGCYHPGACQVDHEGTCIHRTERNEPHAQEART